MFAIKDDEKIVMLSDTDIIMCKKEPTLDGPQKYSLIIERAFPGPNGLQGGQINLKCLDPSVALLKIALRMHDSRIVDISRELA